jgi:DNA-binding transcriptional LysR family regulator
VPVFDRDSRQRGCAPHRALILWAAVVYVPHLDDILIFLKIAQFESLSRAAHSLGMPVSTVSRRLSALESVLGVSLVRRNTRRVTLTPEGREYFDQCQEPLTIIEEAERTLTRTQRAPEGSLRISVPMILAQESFMDFVSAFSREHGKIRIELVVANQFLNFVADNIDVAIRFGEMSDSSLVATPVGKVVRYIVAAPGYLKGRKLPTEPVELQSHDCVLLNAKNNEMDWDLISGRRKVRVRVSGPISSRDCNSVNSFVARGHGIGLLPSTYCEQALAKGELVRLLPRWTSTRIPVHAVYASRKFMPSRLSAFLQALAAWKSPLWVRD